MKERITLNESDQTALEFSITISAPGLINSRPRYRLIVEQDNSSLMFNGTIKDANTLSFLIAANAVNTRQDRNTSIEAIIDGQVVELTQFIICKNPNPTAKLVSLNENKPHAEIKQFQCV